MITIFLVLDGDESNGQHVYNYGYFTDLINVDFKKIFKEAISSITFSDEQLMYESTENYFKEKNVETNEENIEEIIEELTLSELMEVFKIFCGDMGIKFIVSNFEFKINVTVETTIYSRYESYPPQGPEGKSYTYQEFVDLVNNKV